VSHQFAEDLQRLRLIARLMNGHAMEINRHMACVLELERETELLLRSHGIEPKRSTGSTEGAAG
jgi:hypothetical protein